MKKIVSSYLRIIILFILFTHFLPFNLEAQNKINIQGMVKDANTNSGLAGVTVRIKDGTSSTISNPDGTFTLSNIPKNAILVFSFIGMESQEVPVNDKAFINVVMKNDVIELDEIVAIGYGTSKKRDLTGSVSNLSSSDIQKRGTTNVLGAMQGQIAGVNISNASGRAGSAFDMQIRGLNTLSGSSAPLFVVDGVVTNDIDFLNPSDIERIDVLKDASSTAIYGSRGSNGVVIVTTRTSADVKKEGLHVSYDGYVGERRIARVPNYMGGDEWLDWRTDAWMVYGGTDANKNPIFNYSAFGDDPTPNVFVQSPTVLNRFLSKDYVDWFDIATKNGFQQNHYVKLEGKSKNINYVFGFGYQDEEGNVPHDEYKRYNFKLSIESQLSQSIKIGTNVNFSISDRDLGSKYSMRGLLFSPLASPYDANGKLQPTPGSSAGLGSTSNLSFTNGLNPILDQQNVTNNEESKFLLANIYLQVKLMEGLSFQSTLSPVFSDSRRGTYEGIMSNDRFQKNTDAAQLNTGRGMNYTWDNQINFQKDFGERNNLNLLIMQNYYSQTDESSSISGEDFPYNSSFYNMNNARKMVSMGSDYSKQSLLSFTGRANYIYNHKYYLTGTIRWDGSSKLANNKWASFPSVAVAWRLSEEKFMRFNALSNLKIRASYGYTGNNNNIGPYSTMALADARTDYDYGGILATGFAPNGVINRNLTWERTSELDLGIDYGFFDNRISGSIDLYDKTSKGLLMDRLLPIETGWVSMKDNIGSVNNRGIEISLNTVNVSTKDFKWSTSFTFSKNVNKILQLYGSTTEDDVQNRWFIGEPVQVIYGYVFDGIWTRDQQELAAKYGQREGMARVKDFDSSASNHSIDPSDRRILGSPMPSWIGGFSTSFSYKGFDFFLSLFTKQNVYVFSPWLEYFTNYSDRGGQKLSLNFYRPEGTPTLQPDGTFAPGPGNPSQEIPMAYTYNAGDWWHTTKNDAAKEKPGAFTDASFVKIQNISLGYTFKKKWIERAKMSSLRIYLNVLNPFVFTKYKGFDPEWAEASMTGNNAGAYSTITWQAGINVKF